MFSAKLIVLLEVIGVIMERGRNTAVRVWRRLVRIAQKIAIAGSNLIETHGLSGAQFEVLAHIASEEGMSQQTLAEALAVTKGNVSQLIAKLEQERLIERLAEGRTNHLYLTERGRSLINTVSPLHDSYISEKLSVLSEDELGTLYRLLRKLDQSL
jgi:DNA-binding MarR family transcriptional regulator